MMTTPTYSTLARSLFRLSVPVIITSLGNALVGVLGMIIVALLGRDELAAGALATTSYLTLMTFFTSCLFSVGILVSHAKGQQQDHKIGNLVHNGFVLSIWLSIPATILIWFYPHVLILFKQDPLLVNKTVSYFHAAALGLLPMISTTALQQFFVGVGHPKFNVYCTLVRVPVTLILSYALILGRWGLPEMGLGGVMIAPTIILWIYLGFLLAYVKWIPKYRIYQFFSNQYRSSWATCRTLLRIGAPIGLQFGVELAAITVSTYFMGWFGTAALAAQQIASQCTFLMVMVIVGVAQALSLLISHAYGQQDYDLIRRTGTVGFILSAMMMVVVSFMFFFVPDPLINLFVMVKDPHNQHIVHLSRIFLSLAGLLLIADSLRNTAASALRGLQDSITPMWIGGLSLWLISLPLCYFLGFSVHLGPIGLRIGFTSGFILCAIFLSQRFYRYVEKRRGMAEDELLLL